MPRKDVIDPTAPRRSLNLQCLEDPRVFADLVRFMKSSGVPTRGSYSHVVHLILTGTHRTWDCAYFTLQTVENALKYLASEGFSLSQLKSANTGQKLLNHMNAEALAEEAVLPPVDAKRAEDIQKLFSGEAE